MTVVRCLIILAICGVSFAQPDHQVPIDNNQVRVLVVRVPARQKSAMHEHRMNRVMIYLTKADIRITGAGGKLEDQHWKAGDAAWSPARGMHTSESLDDADQRIVEIELKPSAAAKTFVPLGPLDPAHHKVEFENEQVRVVRARFESHQSGPLRDQFRNRVVVPLSPPGAVTWGLPGTHSNQNRSDSLLEILFVDLKTR